LKSEGWCLEPESNQRHKDFQSFALPTELSRLIKRVVQGKNELLFCKPLGKSKFKIMENLADYSRYIFAAYSIASVVLIGLMAFVIAKYFLVKAKIKNEK
jgi:hypothetical protein